MCPFLYVVLSVFSLAAPSSIVLQGALHDRFCNGVVSYGGSLLPRRTLAFQQGGPPVVSYVHLFYVQCTKAEEFPESRRFKCLYASLCLCCQSAALASVELKLGLEAHVSA